MYTETNASNLHILDLPVPHKASKDRPAVIRRAGILFYLAHGPAEQIKTARIAACRLKCDPKPLAHPLQGLASLDYIERLGFP